MSTEQEVVVLTENAKEELATPTPMTEAQELSVDLFWALGMFGFLACMFAVLTLFQGVSIPVLLAMSLAYSLNPLVTWLGDRKLTRLWATTLVFVFLTLLLLGLLFYMVPVLREEASKVPVFFQKAATMVLPWLEARLGVSLPEFLRQRTEEIGSEAASLAQSMGPSFAKWAAVFAGNTARLLATLLGLLVVPVLGFFFLKDYPKILTKARALLPRQAEGLLVRRFEQVDAVLSAFVRGQLAVGVILSAVYSIGLSAARVDMAIFIALVAGFGNMVPYVGTGVGITFASMGLILNWQGPWQVAVVALTFILGQMLESLVITPRVVGSKVGLPPVVVIIAVLGFGEIFGFVGILLAVPTAAILKVVVKVLIERYRKTPFYLGTL